MMHIAMKKMIVVSWMSNCKKNCKRNLSSYEMLHCSFTWLYVQKHYEAQKSQIDKAIPMSYFNMDAVQYFKRFLKKLKTEKQCNNEAVLATQKLWPREQLL